MTLPPSIKRNGALKYFWSMAAITGCIVVLSLLKLAFATAHQTDPTFQDALSGAIFALIALLNGVGALLVASLHG